MKDSEGLVIPRISEEVRGNKLQHYLCILYSSFSYGSTDFEINIKNTFLYKYGPNIIPTLLR